MSGSWTVLLAFLTPLAGAGIVSLLGHRPNLREAASLIAAAFLFQFGSGPIKGFATTLFFGLVSNVFTAMFVSRTMFETVLSRRQTATLSI